MEQRRGDALDYVVSGDMLVDYGDLIAEELRKVGAGSQCGVTAEVVLTLAEALEGAGKRLREKYGRKVEWREDGVRL